MTADAQERAAGRAVLALVVGAVLIRALPPLIWPNLPIIRDEVSYASLAEGLLHGRGIEATAHGWLWAPLYPAFLALHMLLFGSPAAARGTQVLLGGLCALLVYRLGRRLGGERVGLCAGWLYALEPTLIAFSHYLWTESLYTLWLLLALEGALWARDRRPGAALLPGAALGLAVLTRGVGSYALPFLLPALLWKRVSSRQAWARAGLLAASCALVVLPYSLYASRKFGGIVIADTSVGFNMWLGNNAFEPVSFDYRMGGDSLAEEDYEKLGGRPECWQGLPVLEKNRCEIANGLAFIRQKPVLFLQRIWTREAQTFNPSSFLLRNLRWGRYEGLPAWLRSGLCVWVLVAHFLLVCTAALGAAGSAVAAAARAAGARRAVTRRVWDAPAGPAGSPVRAAEVAGGSGRADAHTIGPSPEVRGQARMDAAGAAESAGGAGSADGAGGAGAAQGATGDETRSALRAASWGLTLYHLAATGALIGMSRFRVPLLPLWIPFSALLLVRPRLTLRRAYRTIGSGIFATALLLLVTALSLVYIGRAFPASVP